MMAHVQAEPAELAAELVDGPEQLVRPLGVGVALEVAFSIEQSVLQMVHLRDGSNLFGPGERLLRPDYARRGVLGRIRRSCTRWGWHGVSKSIWVECTQRGNASRNSKMLAARRRHVGD